MLGGTQSGIQCVDGLTHVTHGAVYGTYPSTGGGLLKETTMSEFKRAYVQMLRELFPEYDTPYRILQVVWKAWDDLNRANGM